MHGLQTEHGLYAAHALQVEHEPPPNKDRNMEQRQQPPPEPHEPQAEPHEPQAGAHEPQTPQGGAYVTGWYVVYGIRRAE